VTPRVALLLHPIEGHPAWLVAIVAPPITELLGPMMGRVLPAAEPLLIQAVVADEASPEERARVGCWSDEHGLDNPLSRKEFLSLFRRVCYRQRAAFVSVDDPAITLGPFVVRWGTAVHNPGRGSLSCTIYTAPGEPTERKPLCANGEIEDDRGPRIVIRKIDRLRSFVAFKPTGYGPAVKGKKPRGDGWRGVFMSLRSLGAAQGADEDASLAELCRSFSVASPEHAQEPLDHALNELGAACRLYRELLSRHLTLCPDLPPRAAISAGTYAKTLQRQLHLEAPLARFDSLTEAACGCAMGTYFAGEVSVFERGTRFNVQYLDFGSAYAISAVLTGAWELVAAEDLRTEDVSPHDAARELERLGAVFSAFADGIGPPPSQADWRSAARLILFIEPRGERLPHRVHVLRRWWSRRSPLTYRKGALPYLALDLIGHLLEGGRAPGIVGAIRFVPVGHVAPEHPSTLNGLGISPSRPNPVVELWNAKARAELDIGTPRETREAKRGLLKGVLVSLVSGITAQVNDDEPMKTLRPLVVLDPRTGESSEIMRERIETPGVDYLPPVASSVTAGARLLLRLVIVMVRAAGGRVLYVDTDGLDIDLPFAELQRIRWRIDELIESPDDARSWVYSTDRDGNWIRVPEPRLLKLEPENTDGPVGFRSTLHVAVRAAKKHYLYRVLWSGAHVELTEDGPIVVQPPGRTGAIPNGLRMVRPSWHQLEIDATKDELTECLEYLLRIEWGMEAAIPACWSRPAYTIIPASFKELLELHPGLHPFAPLAVARIPIVGQVTAVWRPGFDPIEAAWKDREGREIQPFPLNRPPIGETIGHVLQRIWRTVDRGLIGEDGEACGPNKEGVVEYGPTIGARMVGIGKESRRFGIGRGLLFAPDTAAYIGDDPWVDALRAGNRLVLDTTKRRRLEEIADLSENGLRNVLAGSQCWGRTREAVGHAIAVLAETEVRLVDAFGPMPTDENDVIYRYLTEVPEPKRRCRTCGKALIGRQLHWCSDACRKEYERQPELPI
jgi:hypothetical protein